MSWFRRNKSGIQSDTKREMPDGLWHKCDGCGEMIHQRQLEDNAHTCPKCNHHFRLSSAGYVRLLLDDGSFEEMDAGLRAGDPLEFTDTKRYAERIPATIAKSGLTDAVRTGTGTLSGHPLTLAAMDFGFIGGSMGSVVGEKIARAVDKSVETKRPLVIISQSGGARMMEGALSLMQMAKTSAKLTRLADAGVPYVSVLTDPTTGGVTASFAMLGDVNIAEPKALIAFAGPRVVRQTIGRDLPEGFQRAEFLQEHGFVDLIVDRKKLRAQLAQLLRLFDN